MAPHSSTLAWKIPWMEEPSGLQSMGSLRVRHSWATSLSLFTFIHWRKKCNPRQCSCLENPRDRGAWWAAVYGVSQSRTRLKRLSSSSSSSSSASLETKYGAIKNNFTGSSLVVQGLRILLSLQGTGVRSGKISGLGRSHLLQGN